MRNRFRHLHHDERGMSLVFVGASLMAFLTATTLAMDVGMFMVSRSQSQNAADAGALAGATALAFDSFTNRSDTGPAKTSAVSTALTNSVIRASVAVAPDSPDVVEPIRPACARKRHLPRADGAPRGVRSRLRWAHPAPRSKDRARTAGAYPDRRPS